MSVCPSVCVLPVRSPVVAATAQGAGWELAAALLRPRMVEVEKDTGRVSFVDGGDSRMAASAALRHRFIRMVGGRLVRAGLTVRQMAGAW
jgi:hypothetical protein